jgi:hypothetical protein
VARRSPDLTLDIESAVADLVGAIDAISRNPTLWTRPPDATREHAISKSSSATTEDALDGSSELTVAVAVSGPIWKRLVAELAAGFVIVVLIFLSLVLLG